jgi:hypothetical protein
MKKAFLQFWLQDSNPAGCSLHLDEKSLKKFKSKVNDLTAGDSIQVEISKNLFFEIVYNDGILELMQNSLNNLRGLGEIKIEGEEYAY